MTNHLAELLEYSKEHPEFDSTFVMSVKSWANAHKGHITDKQRSALMAIHRKF